MTAQTARHRAEAAGRCFDMISAKLARTQNAMPRRLVIFPHSARAARCRPTGCWRAAFGALPRESRRNSQLASVLGFVTWNTQGRAVGHVQRKIGVRGEMLYMVSMENSASTATNARPSVAGEHSAPPLGELAAVGRSQAVSRLPAFPCRGADPDARRRGARPGAESLTKGDLGREHNPALRTRCGHRGAATRPARLRAILRSVRPVLFDAKHGTANDARQFDLCKLHADTIAQCRVVSTKYVAMQRYLDATGKRPERADA